MTDEQRQRVHDLLYSCDDRAELCEKVVLLEELAVDMWREIAFAYMEQVTTDETLREFSSRMTQLGIEVGP